MWFCTYNTRYYSYSIGFFVGVRYVLKHTVLSSCSAFNKNGTNISIFILRDKYTGFQIHIKDFSYNLFEMHTKNKNGI